MPADDKDDGY